MSKSFIIGLLLPALAFTVVKTHHLVYPNHFPEPVYDFEKNPLSEEKVELGRRLFYDPILSKDGTVSCASCHSSFNAFAHTDHALSHGIDDSIGTRNAPALMNLAWQRSFMWDGAVNHLDVQALAPITHPAEMGERIENVVAKLQASRKYPELFLDAFGDSIITGEHLLKALSQFQLSLISTNSKYDRVMQGVENFSAQEQNGYSLFKKNCNSCHAEPLFSNYSFANNGLPIDTTLKDLGRWKVTKEPEDSLKFKVPSLRNLSYTYPYMHDGRFDKLRQVLEHYTSGMRQDPTLAPELSTPMVLSENDKVDLIAFLLTLDDEEFVRNPKFQFPREIFMRSEVNGK